MTEAPTDRAGDDAEPPLTMEDVDAYLTQLVRTVQAQESLISDLLQCMVAIDAASMDHLRHRAAAELAKAHETRWTDPEADEQEFLHRTRFCAYDRALARAGRFWKPCEVVSLDAARRR